MRRSLVGAGDRGGRLRLELISNIDAPLIVRCTEDWPPWLLVYWHTLHALPLLDVGTFSIHAEYDVSQLQNLSFRPARPVAPVQIIGQIFDGPHAYDAPELGGGGAEALGGAVEVGRHHHLEYAVSLAPRGSLAVEITFAKPVLHVDATLADSSRGLPIGLSLIHI